jgi:hypothetical protein
MTRCGPQTKHTVEWFVCCNMRVRCHGNACIAKRCLAMDIYFDFTIPASCVMSQYDFKLKDHSSYVWVQNAMY